MNNKVETSSVKKKGGRKAGVPNKATISAKLLAEKMGVDPFEILLHIANGNYIALGFKETEACRLTLDHRLLAAKEAVKYLRPQLRAIEHSGNIDGKQTMTIEQFLRANPDEEIKHKRDILQVEKESKKGKK